MWKEKSCVSPNLRQGNKGALIALSPCLSALAPFFVFTESIINTLPFYLTKTQRNPSSTFSHLVFEPSQSVSTSTGGVFCVAWGCVRSADLCCDLYFLPDILLPLFSHRERDGRVLSYPLQPFPNKILHELRSEIFHLHHT